MKISYDPRKNDWNFIERNLPFELAKWFDWETALVKEDIRFAYGERRFQALGYIGDRLHVLVYTPRFDTTHIISLRKANSRESAHYEKEKAKP